MFVLSLVVLTDIAVGLVFKRQQTELHYGKSVTVRETVFIKRTLV